MKNYKTYATNEKTLKTTISKEFTLINDAFDWCAKHNKTDLNNIYTIGYPENKKYLSR